MEDAVPPSGSPRLDPTGVPGLDAVLGGGLPRGALALVVGPPGSGKTTLAAQMAVAAVRAGHPALILTAFSEPTTKLLGHLRTLRFFDAALVGDRLQVLSLTQFLPQGLDATAEEVRTLVRRGRFRLVVLDGLRGMRGAEPGADEQATRRFLYTVGGVLGPLGATAVITSEAEPRDAALYPEATTADALLGVHYGLVGLRECRYLEVIKVRGLAKRPGLHALTLTEAGAAVYPRLEARVAPLAGDAGTDADDPAPAATGAPLLLEDRAAFGLPELDALLEGGLTRETSTILQGSPGAGKTLLALHWVLTAIAAGEPTVYLGFREHRRQLLLHADAFGLGVPLRTALTPGGPLTFLRLAPVELDPDVLADALLAALDRCGARRLVIDSIGELERAVAEGGTPQRVPGYVAALVEALRARRVTTLAIREGAHLVAAGPEVATDTLAVLAENVLLLQQVTMGDRLRRLLSAPKMRFSAHDLRIREFTITPPGGIRVLAPVAPTEDGSGDRATPLELWAEADEAGRRDGGVPDPDRGG